MPRPAPTVAVFDLGNVLIDWNPRHLYRKLFDGDDTAMEQFLATVCKQEKAGLGCPANQKAQFGTLNPHARSSLLVSIEFTGKDKVTVRGAERELSRFMLRSETGDWAIWLEDSFKIVRLLGDNGIEGVRD